MKKTNLLLSAVTILLTGLTATIFAQTADVYVVGTPYSHLCVWKNDEIIFKPEGLHCRAYKISVSDGDMYVVGIIFRDTHHIDAEVVVWKNGEILYTLTDSPCDNYFVCSIFISGKDVYVTCSENSNNGPQSSTAKVWKNGALLYTISDTADFVLPILSLL
jgi:hypothetical protein